MVQQCGDRAEVGTTGVQGTLWAKAVHDLQDL